MESSSLVLTAVAAAVVVERSSRSHTIQATAVRWKDVR